MSCPTSSPKELRDTLRSPKTQTYIFRTHFDEGHKERQVDQSLDGDTGNL